MSGRLAALALLALLALAGCGYGRAGHASHLPTEVRTIAIPSFENRTQTYRIEQILTAAVAREFTTRTHYHIVYENYGDADAILKGIITNATLAPATYDSQTGRASTAIVTVDMHMTLTDRNGKVLFENPGYQFREQYQVSREISSFFAEESPAMQRLSRDFARTLVSNVLEAF